MEPFSTQEDLGRLPEPARAALMGLAGLGLPASNSHLARVMATAGMPLAQAWAGNPGKLQEVLLQLKERGLAQANRSGYWTCTERSVEAAARAAFKAGLLRRLFQGAVAGAGFGSVQPDARLRVRAELRLALMEDQHERWLALREAYARSFGEPGRDPLALVCGGPFEPAWFEALDPAAQAYGCQALLLDQALLGLPGPAFRTWLDARTGTPRAAPMATSVTLFLLLQGRFEEAAVWTAAQAPGQRQTYAWAAVAALAALAAGQPAQAAAGFEASLALLRKATRKRSILLPGLFEPFHVLALLALREPQALRQAQARIELLERRDWDDPLGPAAGLLRRLALALAGGRAERPGGPLKPRKATPLLLFLELLAAYLGGEALAEDLPERVRRACAALPLGWFEGELGELQQRLQGRPPRPSPLLDLVPREAAWERVLESLQQLGAPAAPAGPAQPLRLAWVVSPGAWDEADIELEPREQKAAGTGQWTRGRKVSPRKLREETRLYDYLTPQDRRIIGCFNLERDDFGRDASTLDPGAALAAMVGHPHLFWLERGEEAPFELLEGTPELRVRQAGATLELSLEPRPGRSGILLAGEGKGRRRLFRFSEVHRRLAELLGERLVVPASAQERVLRSLAAVAPLVAVHSDLGVAEEVSARAGLEPRAGCPDPAVILLPAGAGLRVQVRVHPLPGGPAHVPGQGGTARVLEQDGRRLLVHRDLRAEDRAVEALLDRLPALDPDLGEDREWLLQDPDRCLDLLLQLQALEGQVPVFWPEGRHLQTPVSLGPGSMRLKVGAAGGWLEVDGELRVDPERVLSLKAALALVDAHPGRYLPLAGGAWLSLTQPLRRRLQDLRALGDPRGKGLRLPAAAALALEELGQGLDLVGDPAWRSRLAGLGRAKALEPAVPPGLEADLRAYQAEGFRWMTRLAAAGLGACLADDMGLGKTVQALALLLDRGGQGPALVVAPTSVCANWAQEAARFAPGLRVLRLADGDRAALLEQAGPMDLVVASYALLHLEAASLQRTAWATVILDEAQNIKNALTKRSQSAMALQAGFRLALSGTPLENHLGELWNLFRFLNPGLLGSAEAFQRRFQIPVERDRDPEALRRLKRLTAPFLLRRTKAQVLAELPPRTEITLELEPGPREAAFLEALRRRTLEQLDAAGELQALQVLAAITRLRRACCHPDLAQPGLDLPSAKLEAFLELVQEIRDNRHRALVFSQFVDHLAILRRSLDRAGIPYHYLDGATPAPRRTEAVAAFQRGEHDLFLISLKAGGTGLNLTGADVVIHMDPWWNPAVEDQASDRAHRIGQLRPVTIYRLVLKGTIEQKIVGLHGQKRDLAERLLEGSASPARLDAAGLLDLLRG